MSKIQFHRVDLNRVPWETLDRFADRTVFQSRAWLEFVAESQDATPVVAELRDGSDVVGFDQLPHQVQSLGVQQQTAVIARR